jgi:hypothetical protein
VNKSLLQDRLRALGAPGVIALGLLVFCLVFHLFWAAPLRAELARLEARLARSQAERPDSAAAPSGAERVPRELEELLRVLPVQATLGAQVKEIHAVALKHNVGLRRGGYELVWETAGRFGRQRMVFQSDAAYGALRAFLREVLARQPALALEDASFSRRVGSGTLETTLTLTLLVARAPEDQ